MSVVAAAARGVAAGEVDERRGHAAVEDPPRVAQLVGELDRRAVSASTRPVPRKSASAGVVAGSSVRRGEDQRPLVHGRAAVGHEDRRGERAVGDEAVVGAGVADVHAR